MDPMSILVPLLIAALIALVVVLVLMVLKLTKALEAASDTIAKLEPTIDNVQAITTDIQPTVRKIEPIVDRVQLTLDSVNLEMMRVDEILGDVSRITDSAASASNAVENIANAPAKAVSGVADKVREHFGLKGASGESAQLGDNRAAIEQALEEYKAANEKEEAAATPDDSGADKSADPQPEPEPEASGKAEKPYTVIDPDVIENSPFFDDQPKDK